MDGKKIKVDLTEEIMFSILENSSFPENADYILDNCIDDKKLNDAVSMAFGDCVQLGYIIGYQTALSLVQGKTDIEIEL